MRVVDRLLAVLLSVGLLVLGVLVPVEIVRAALGRGHAALPYEGGADRLRQTSWNDTAAIVTFVALTLVGLLLLGLELRRRRPAALGLRTLTPDVDTSTTRRSLQAALRRSATEVDGIDAATVRISRRTATVTASSGLPDPTGLEQQVAERVKDELGSLSLVHPPTVQVRLRTRRATS